MKLVALAFSQHDFSITYFDGEKIKYHKLERTKQIKRFGYFNHWEWIYEIKNLWNVDIDDIDEIIMSADPIPLYGEIPPIIQTVVTGEINAVRLPDELNPFLKYTQVPVWFISHHYAHSLSTWMLTDTADISFVFDGAGDARSWSVFKNDKLIDGAHLSFGSIGWGMADAGKYLGVKFQPGMEDDIAGKVMGLQSYGSVDQDYLEILRTFDIRKLKDIFSIEHWELFKGDTLVAKLTPLDWIATVHQRISELLLELFRQHAGPNDIISYTGGVAQNVIWNTDLKKHFKNLVIPPHSADEGLTLGAIEWLRIKNKLPRFTLENFPYIQSDVSPDSLPSIELIQLAARLLAEGKTVGWYQGQGEVGPRALGNRSVLMDPRIKNGREKINQIKKRENYRPFGASILKEYVDEYFDLDFEDKFMLYTAGVKTPELDAITHVDDSCRVQTVGDDNPIFKKLLEEFYKLTGCPILLNTSLNLAGKPLAGYPETAQDFLAGTELDCLFIGNEFYKKRAGLV